MPEDSWGKQFDPSLNYADFAAIIGSHVWHCTLPINEWFCITAAVGAVCLSQTSTGATVLPPLRLTLAVSTAAAIWE